MATKTRFAIPTLVSAFALLAVAAHAADDVTKPADSNNPDNTLAPIIVTAQKRSEDVQSVPISISVIGSEQLEQMHATQLSDYVNYLPGVQMITSGTPGLGAVAMRGISPLGSNATVSTYIDETPLGSSSFYARSAGNVLDLLPYDVESFQALRGPQGTLWGAGALGGVIQYVTRQPDLDQFSMRVGGDVFGLDGSGGLGVGARASLNAPLIPGQLGLSVSLARQNTPGYIDNHRTGESDQNSFSQTAGRVALRWKATDDLTISLAAIKQKIDGDNNANVALDPLTLQPIYGKRYNNNYVPEPTTRDLDYFTATVNWDAGFADFVSATSYSQTIQRGVQDATMTYGVLFPAFGQPAPGLSDFRLKLNLYKVTQEFRLASKSDDRFEWLVGTFYTNETSRNYQRASAEKFDGTPIPGLDPLALAQLPSSYKEYALFGNVTWKFNDKFDIGAGLRWARNEQEFTQISSGSILPTTITPGSSAETVRTWSVGPRWHLTPDTMLYARVATGYQPGGPNVVLPGVPATVGADTLTNYEFGLKTSLIDHRLILDAAVFNIDWKKIQVSASNNVATYLVNGGTANSKGLEFSALYTPVNGLRLGLNGAYTDAKLTENVPAVGGLDGDRLPFIPKWSGSATADYSFPLSGSWTMRVGGGLRYVGDSYTMVNHSPLALPMDSYAAVDLNADIANDRWTVRFFVKNATNKNVYVSLSPIQNGGTGAISQVSGTPLQPRIVGVGFDLKL
ncbi:MAG: TonB-dependent receptor [Rudaea sp.]|uniref:TonB-dependent receptor n=1 Tax=unclassified Rudaea TaxID=2627037 RepID=UPI0010F991D0|nr:MULTISPECIES: TonB-dependent receptor [unclassified Rudaea]MBN8887690.1 TonB-dependent receptor [Rudaea sp.]